MLFILKKTIRSLREDMASRGFLHPADSFCYVCGKFIKTRAKKYSVEASRIMCEVYIAYFGVQVGDQDKSWAPHFTCEYCKNKLEGKLNSCFSLRCVLIYCHKISILKIWFISRSCNLPSFVLGRGCRQMRSILKSFHILKFHALKLL